MLLQKCITFSDGLVASKQNRAVIRQHCRIIDTLQEKRLVLSGIGNGLRVTVKL